MASDSSTVFDRVLVKDGSDWRALSIEEFFGLPLSMRVRLVIERTVAFTLDGKAVDQKEALSALRRLRAKAGPEGQ